MIFKVVLSYFIIFCMLYNTISLPILLVICILTSYLLIYSHKNGTIRFTDNVSRESKIYSVNSKLKIISVFILLIFCISSKNLKIIFICIILSFFIVVIIGKVKIKYYINFISIPLSFIIFAIIPVIFKYSNDATGVINIPILNGYIYVDELSQKKATFLFCKVLGCMHISYVVILSMTINEIITSLKEFKIPVIISDLMYLIYRCIFIMFNMYEEMYIAAKSRLGFINYRRSIQNTAKIYTNLLIKSYIKSNILFDSMQSRCYESNIRFLRKEEKKLKKSHLIVSFIIVITILLFYIVY